MNEPSARIEAVVRVGPDSDTDAIPGSGVIVSRAGHVLTCWHVVQGQEQLKVAFRDGSSADAIIAYSDEKQDIAILETGTPQTKYCSLGSASKLGVGDKVLVVSFPSVGTGSSEEKPTVVTAAISNITEQYLKLDRATGIGSSGGAVYCAETGMLVAMIVRELAYVDVGSRSLPTGQAGFAVPIDRLLEPLAIYAGIEPSLDHHAKSEEIRRAVGNTLRASGYDISSNYQVLGTKVDFLAIKRELGATIRIAVQCVASPVPLRVDPIRALSHALSISTTTSQPIDKGILVTNTRPSAEATAEAQAAGIVVIRLQDFLTNAVDFRPHIHQVMASYEALDYSGYFVLAPCETEHGREESASQYVLSRLTDPSAKPVAMLGDFGMGKSALCHRMAYELACQWQNSTSESARIPVHIPLAWCGRAASLQDVATSTMREALGVSMTHDTFLYLSRLGRFVFILDGLDEMSDRVDSGTLNENLRELFSLLRLGENQLLLSCRTHFFRRKLDEEHLADWEIIRLLPWEPDQWRTYLAAKNPVSWAEQIAKIDSIYKLSELAKTPMLLDMISSSWEEIADEQSPIDSALLYKLYFQTWLREQASRKGAILDPERKTLLMEELAYRMLANDTLSMNVQELEGVLLSDFGVPAESLPQVSNDLRSCSFLVRKGDLYAFAHTSFMEFLIARKYHRELLTGAIKDFGKVYFKAEIFQFLLELLDREEDISALHKLARTCGIARGRIHLIFLLGRLGRQESRAELMKLILEDEYSRVSGHAAEILFTRFNQGNAFDILISSLQKQPYDRNRSTPEEPNIGWFTVAGDRTFRLESERTLRFFLDALRGCDFDDPNLRWYASSVLSRVANLSDFITDDDVRCLSALVRSGQLPRVRAYSALVLKNLHREENEVISALNWAAENDEDNSVRKAARFGLLAMENCVDFPIPEKGGENRENRQPHVD